MVLRISDRYKHLGGIVSADASMTAELWSRIGSGAAVYKEIRRPVFADRTLSLSTRSGLADSLVDSRNLYNAAVWPRIPQQDVDRSEVARARPYRTILGLEPRPDAPAVGSSRALQCARATPTRRCITTAHLRYRLCFEKAAPPLSRAMVWSSARGHDSWTAVVHEDVECLKAITFNRHLV